MTFKRKERGYITIPLLIVVLLASISAYMVNREAFLYYHLVKDECHFVRCQYEAERGLSYALMRVKYWEEGSIPSSYTLGDNSWPYETKVSIESDKEANKDPKSLAKGKMYWIKSVSTEKGKDRIVAMGAYIRVQPYHKNMINYHNERSYIEEDEHFKAHNRIIVYMIRRF